MTVSFRGFEAFRVFGSLGFRVYRGVGGRGNRTKGGGS